MLPAAGACPPEVFASLLEKGSPAFGVSLSSSQIAKLSCFLAELDQARRLTNLTGPLTPATLTDHAIESVLGEKLIPHGARVIDIGSGAGFPGLPLAIAREDVSVTALEPRRKRADFLRHVIDAVPISNCQVVQKRAEAIQEGSWNVIVCRAVGRIDRVMRSAKFLAGGGLFISWATDAAALALGLGPSYGLESRIEVPGSDRKVIAAYRLEIVPRGTNRFGKGES